MPSCSWGLLQYAKCLNYRHFFAGPNAWPLSPLYLPAVLHRAGLIPLVHHGLSESLVALKKHLVERLLDFERLDVVEREAESAGAGLVG